MSALTERLESLTEQSVDAESYITSRLENPTPTVTIKDVGIFFNPIVTYREREQFGETKEYDHPLGADVYTYTTQPNRAALLGFAVDDDTEYTVEDFDDWMDANRLPPEIFSEYQSWIADHADRVYPNIYQNQSKTVWRLKGDFPSGGQANLIPHLSIGIVFEDEHIGERILYTPFAEQPSAIMAFFNRYLSTTEVTPEADNEDTDEDNTEESESEDSEGKSANSFTTYTLDSGVEATFDSGVLRFGELEITSFNVEPLNWYTIPLFDAVERSDVTEREYDILASYDGTYFTETVDVSFASLMERGSVELGTWADYTVLPDTISWTGFMQTFFDEATFEDESVTIPIQFASPLSLSPEDASDDLTFFSNTATWGVRPKGIEETSAEQTDADTTPTDDAEESHGWLHRLLR